MKGTIRADKADKKYIESGRWKCEKSPTGAHYWVITGVVMRCKYCDEKRRFGEVKWGQESFAIVGEPSEVISVALKKRWQDPEYRAKLSAGLKKRWQNPEYRAKQIATHTGRHPTAETRAKISAVLTRRQNKKGHKG